MTASYSLSPDRIDAVVTEQFDEVPGGDGTVALVAADGEEGETETVVGFAAGVRDGDAGEMRWLFVDPEYRGRGIGTALFEAALERLRDGGATHIRAATLEANTEGSRFFERFGYERIEDRQIEIGDEDLVEYVYAESEEADERADSAEGEDAVDGAGDRVPDDLPKVEMRDGVPTATTGDGRRVYIDPDETESGSEGPFLPAYLDAEMGERFGYYCSNCGSLDVSMDDMERMRCGECGNDHAVRSSRAYDDSYL